MNSFNIIQDSYEHLLKDLDSDYLSPGVKNLAQSYHYFTQAVEKSFTSQDFSLLHNAWENFLTVFEIQPFNLISLSLYIGDMDYSIKKNYLYYLVSCQNFIAQKFFSTFTLDLDTYIENKSLIPPCVYFFQWLENPTEKIKYYFKLFSQEHFNTLAEFNSLPEFETFLNHLFLRSKKEYDKNSFDNEYFLFHVENLKIINTKGIYVDVLLKNNTLNLPEDFVDYIKFSSTKLNNKSIQQSLLEVKEIQEFFIVYQKQKFEYLFPAKNIKTKTNKI